MACRKLFLKTYIQFNSAVQPILWKVNFSEGLSITMAKIEAAVELFGRKIQVTIEKSEKNRLEEAVKLIESIVTQYKQSIKVPDNTYLAMMCCIDIATQLVQANHQLTQLQQTDAEALRKLALQMDETLNLGTS